MNKIPMNTIWTAVGSLLSAALIFTSGLAISAQADVMVPIHVKAKGAKFIGTSMGGVEVIITHHRTGKVLAKGITQGKTGNTAKLMNSTNDLDMITDGAAVFMANLDIASPTRVDISLRGPLGFTKSQTTVTVNDWILPQKDQAPRIYEMAGLVLDPTEVRLEGTTLRLKARVVMLCGCPFSPGGLWDADKAHVWVEIRKNHKVILTQDMSFDDGSQFEVELEDERLSGNDIEVHFYAVGPKGENRAAFGIFSLPYVKGGK